MGVLQKGKAKYPFWGASTNLITGLDPLGLQITSETTYTKMLPGVSNLTNRLRYYGFYCWLLDLYFKMEEKGNSLEQNRFIRRAELMIAIIMQSKRKDVLQITGSNFATALLNTNKTESFDLATGADRDNANNNVYWKYPSGAFGQYYFGAMQTLALVITVENMEGVTIFNISQPHPRQKVSGKDLADVFDNSLTSQIKTLFYNSIKNGILYRSDIDKLVTYFAIDVINTDSKEWELYFKMLMDKDEPGQEVEELFTFHRRDTIMSLVKAALKNKNQYNWYKYLLECYHNKLGSEAQPETETNIGWYCYQLNEYWQFACGLIFWAVLEHLYESQQDQYLPAFIKGFAKSITSAICKELNQSSDSTTLLSSILKNTSRKKEEDIESESISIDQHTLVARNGFMLLFVLFNNNYALFHLLKEYMRRMQTDKDGNMVDGLLTIQAAKSESLQEFVEQFLLRKIIYRHQMVVLRKMGNGSQATNKFFIEEQYIRFIDAVPPRHTSPRMNALQNILYDLQILDKKNVLTQLHQKILID